MRRLIHRERWGLLVNWRAMWVGAHGSAHTGRICINLIPCITVWVCRQGGTRP